MTAGYGKITGQQMMGLNCTACHVGELHYNGRAFRDGRRAVDGLHQRLREGHRGRDGRDRAQTAAAPALPHRWRRVQLVPLPDAPVVLQASAVAPASTNETLDAGEPGLGRVLAGLRMAIANRSLLMDKLHGFSAVKLVVQAQPLGTEEGYGRNDAFGVGRNELFGAHKNANFTEGINVLPADAPVSFPHLWGMERTSWFQWGVNTNSVIERNIGQALGVGATMEPDKGFSSTVRVDNLHAMEMLSISSRRRCGRPSCSGRSTARAERQKLFDRTCALCHETYGKSGSLNEYQLFALDVVGTDPGAAINFERTVMTAEGPKPFGIAAFEIVKKVKAATTPSTTSRPTCRRNGNQRRRVRKRSSVRRCSTTRSSRTPAARRLSREDAEGNLGDGAVPPQRLGPHHLRSAPSGERAPDGSSSERRNTTR